MWTQGDEIRARALGIIVEQEQGAEPYWLRGDALAEHLAQRLADAHGAERRAWREAARWRLAFWIAAICAVLAVLGAVLLQEVQR